MTPFLAMTRLPVVDRPERQPANRTGRKNPRRPAWHGAHLGVARSALPMYGTSRHHLFSALCARLLTDGSDPLVGVIIAANRNHASDLVGFETERHRAHHARQDDDVVKLFHDSFDTQPVNDIPGPEVDDLKGTARIDAFFSQIVVQLQPDEGLDLAGFGQADYRVVPRECQSAYVAGAKGLGFKPPLFGIGDAKMSGSGIKQP